MGLSCRSTMHNEVQRCITYQSGYLSTPAVLLQPTSSPHMPRYTSWTGKTCDILAPVIKILHHAVLYGTDIQMALHLMDSCVPSLQPCANCKVVNAQINSSTLPRYRSKQTFEKTKFHLRISVAEKLRMMEM
ncbi:hypothetical protein GBF38_004618 [Nibea albiflora]|uniref:Uncharacterized protein n=1 Tax=Nibea albiflora TaxID=240163 RepID=A0ACB7FD11_NIBAL|nr:hypothetical protein GBF38_004618 [Nibea albiflora]